jgi:hypothetical protein
MAARNDALSYTRVVDSKPKTIATHFGEFNKIIIYPERHDTNQI